MRKLFAMWYQNITNPFKSHNYIMLGASLCYILCVAASSCTGKKSERVKRGTAVKVWQQQNAATKMQRQKTQQRKRSSENAATQQQNAAR